MQTIKLLIMFMLIFSCSITNAQINYSNNQVFRVYSSSANVSMDIYFDAFATSGSITSVYANINGTVLALKPYQIKVFIPNFLLPEMDATRL